MSHCFGVIAIEKALLTTILSLEDIYYKIQYSRFNHRWVSWGTNVCYMV